MIFYYYAKLVIAPSAGFHGNYRFIIDAYKRLKAGQARMSDHEREVDLADAVKDRCAFCGARSPECLPTHVVSPSYGVPPGVHNLVMACPSCSQSKEGTDLVQWWCKILDKPRDQLPRLPLGMYLKIAYELHAINFTLQKPCNELGELFKVLAPKNGILTNSQYCATH